MAWNLDTKPQALPRPSGRLDASSNDPAESVEAFEGLFRWAFNLGEEPIAPSLGDLAAVPGKLPEAVALSEPVGEEPRPAKAAAVKPDPLSPPADLPAKLAPEDVKLDTSIAFSYEGETFGVKLEGELCHPSAQQELLRHGAMLLKLEQEASAAGASKESADSQRRRRLASKSHSSLLHASAPKRARSGEWVMQACKGEAAHVEKKAGKLEAKVQAPKAEVPKSEPPAGAAKSEYASLVDGKFRPTYRHHGGKLKVHVPLRKSGVRNVYWTESRLGWSVQHITEGRTRTRWFVANTYLRQGKALEEAISAALDDAKCYREELRAKGLVRDVTGTGTKKFAARTSGCKGVFWHKRKSCWQAELIVKGKYVGGKYFHPTDQSEEAIDAARLKAMEHRRRLERKFCKFVGC